MSAGSAQLLLSQNTGNKDSNDDDSDDDAECTGESLEESTNDDDELIYEEIYKEHFVGQEEQQMDTTEETKDAEGIEQTGKMEQTSGLMIKVKKLEKPKVLKSILPYEPPVTRHRSSMTPEKMLGEQLLEQFEKLEAEKLHGVKEMAEIARITPNQRPEVKQKRHHWQSCQRYWTWNRWRLEILRGQLQVR